MDKKILTIIILAVLLGGLLVFTITTRQGVSVEDFEEIRTERDSLNRTITQLRGSLGESASRVGELEGLISISDKKIKAVLDELSQGYQRTDGYLNEYGAINSDFREFLGQNGKEE